MVAPVSDSYSCESGGGIYGGRFNYPLWRRGKTPLAWIDIGGNTLADIDPNDDPAINPDYPNDAVWHGNIGQRAIFDAWCGFVYDPILKRLIAPLGGGHWDYAGNESYYFDFMLDVPMWVMLHPPSGSKPLIDAEGIPAGATPLNNSFLLDDGQEASGLYADGRPRSIHNYRKHVWTPDNIVMVRQGGTFRSATDSDKWTWAMNQATGVWTYMHTPTPVLGIGYRYGSGMYDHANDKVMWIGSSNSGLWEIDRTTFQWSRIGTASKNSSKQCGFIYCDDLELIFGVANSFTISGMAVWDAVADTITEITTTGTPPSFDIDGYKGFAWVPKYNAVAFFSGASGLEGEVWLLTAPSNPKTEPWVWSQLATVGTTSYSTSANAAKDVDGDDTKGVYSQFGYSAELDGFYFAGGYNLPFNFLPLS